MTIAEIIRNGKGKAHAWRVERDYLTDSEWTKHVLWHYSTPMAGWYRRGNEVRFTFLSLGHGSVSDQNGMNTLFRQFGTGWYYSRKGGAAIRDLVHHCRITSDYLQNMAPYSGGICECNFGDECNCPDCDCPDCHMGNYEHNSHQ